MTDTIYKKLAKIQKELNAPKNNTNNFGNYKYRSCEDIIEAVKPLLGDLILNISDEVVMIGERYYIKATATITDGENKVSTTAFAREALEKKGMDVSQISGSTSSYSRKYALNGLLAIDDTKDADTQDNTKTVEKPRTSDPVASETPPVPTFPGTDEPFKEPFAQSGAPVCQKCGKEMIFKSGTSKAGKPWKAYRCPDWKFGSEEHDSQFIK
ncbi:ERF family protein [Patescibacteria group bacterium]|nr:ERF family protein [Patescibacteria group bacterium]